MSTQYYATGSYLSLMTTELNSLASSSGLTAGAISSVGGSSGLFNNAYGGGGIGGYPWAEVEIALASLGGAPTAGSAVYVWFLKSVDGSTYEDGSASVIPARQADAVIPLRAATGTQRASSPPVPIPPGGWYVLLAQNTGQTLASSGNTLRILPVSYQGV